MMYEVMFGGRHSCLLDNHSGVWYDSEEVSGQCPVFGLQNILDQTERFFLENSRRLWNRIHLNFQQWIEKEAVSGRYNCR